MILGLLSIDHAVFYYVYGGGVEYEEFIGEESERRMEILTAVE